MFGENDIATEAIYGKNWIVKMSKALIADGLYEPRWLVFCQFLQVIQIFN